MTMLILDQYVEQRVRNQRAESGDNRYDEVWEGVYMMMALPNNQHQQIVGGLTGMLDQVVRQAGLGIVCPGANISDRDEDWLQNYRCPDIVVFVQGTAAIDRESHWQGGPDLAIEVVSDRDESRRKIPFYASVGVRELLLVDRMPWKLELYRLQADELVLAEQTTPDEMTTVTSQVVGVELGLVKDADRPAIVATHRASGAKWRI